MTAILGSRIGHPVPGYRRHLTSLARTRSACRSAVLRRIVPLHDLAGSQEPPIRTHLGVTQSTTPATVSARRGWTKAMRATLMVPVDASTAKTVPSFSARPVAVRTRIARRNMTEARNRAEAVSHSQRARLAPFRLLVSEYRLSAADSSCRFARSIVQLPPIPALSSATTVTTLRPSRSDGRRCAAELSEHAQRTPPAFSVPSADAFGHPGTILKITFLQMIDSRAGSFRTQRYTRVRGGCDGCLVDLSRTGPF